MFVFLFKVKENLIFPYVKENLSFLKHVVVFPYVSEEGCRAPCANAHYFAVCEACCGKCRRSTDS
jgi:hypothetical protein